MILVEASAVCLAHRHSIIPVELFCSVNPHTHGGRSRRDAFVGRGSKCEWRFQAIRVHHVPMFEKDRIERRFDLPVAALEGAASARLHLTLRGRKRAEHRREGCAVNIDRGEGVADVVAAPRSML
jgi:hypothetical protein